ncbi:hypothetical protein JYU34_010821 [Plutella xylostella]|uniref:MYND-type domain-containing protein n=1 Tax=Plutella xylostella TaxID=51655 RepID=A0ABQ7QJ01_PLUXY|nr:hypothetical protein JYU34_010821 [Plutella xylostella]
MKNKCRNTDSVIRAGEVLLTEEPFVFVLSSKEKGNRCDNCLEKGKVLKCSGCQFVHYCGRSCQKEAWNVHKWECNNLKRMSPKVIPDAARMLARLINRLNRGDGASHRAFYTHSAFRTWRDLMSHYQDLKADSRRMEHFTSLCAVLTDFLKDISMPNAVEMMGIYGRMVINSFTILDVDMNSIGTGIYVGCSVVDHSCAPNAVATFTGRTISVRATQDLPSLDWNQIRISYIDLMKTPYERQAELLQNYYFLCQCTRCLDETQLKMVHAAKCLNDQCNNPVQIPWKKDVQLVMRPDQDAENKQNVPETNGYGYVDDVIHCSECGYKYTEQHIEKFRKAMEFTEVHIQEMKSASVAYVDVCKYCLSRQEGVLHALNVLRAQTLDHALDALIQVQLWDHALEYADALIPCFRFYYGDRHPLLGLLHLKYGKMLLYKMDLQKAMDQLKKSEKILKITHGDKHPLYREELLPLLRQAIAEAM